MANLLFAQKELPKNLCISAEEYRLYQLINTLRKVNDMPTIDLSASLSYVAHLHVADLNQNHPDTSICNLHSWSDKGDWTACCYQAYVPKQECMWNKPKELTSYNGNGFEIAFGTSGYTVNAVGALEAWKKSSGHNAVIINEGVWKTMNWQAVGIGIYHRVMWNH